LGLKLATRPKEPGRKDKAPKLLWLSWPLKSKFMFLQGIQWIRGGHDFYLDVIDRSWLNKKTLFGNNLLGKIFG